MLTFMGNWQGVFDPASADDSGDFAGAVEVADASYAWLRTHEVGEVEAD